MRAPIDRFIATIARLATRWFFRSVEVEGFDEVPRDRPVLLVANHFNGLVDPVLLVAGLGRLPRFMAKSTLWKVLPLRPLLALAGVIPVYRPRDGDTAGNAASFAKVVEVLEDGGRVAIFPEGTTHDEPRLAEVRTGAARIAALAWAGGDDLVILPVGMTYEDKVALRSRALIRVGRPITRDDLDGPVSVEDHASVRALTDRITEALAGLAPDFSSSLQAGALARAAEVALRDPDAPPTGAVPLAAREDLARRLSRRPEAEQEALIDQVGRYQLALDLVHVSDRALAPVPRTSELLRQLIGLGIGMFVLLPLALAGFLINTPPALLVALAGRSVTAPVTKGTVRVLTALVVFPVTWVLLAVYDVGGGLLEASVRLFTLPLSPVLDIVVDSRGGFWPSVVVFVACPLFGLATIWVLEHWGRLVRRAHDWRAVRDRRGQLEDALTARAALVAAVRA